MILKLIVSLVLFGSLFGNIATKAQEEFGQEFVKAKVTKVLFSGNNEAQPPQFEQFVNVEFLEGPKQGQVFESLKYNRTLPSNQIVSEYQKLAVGDEVILLSSGSLSSSSTEYQVEDKYRLGSVYWVVGAVILLFVILYRKKAILSLVCLGGSVYAITAWLLPLINNGQNPVIWSLIIASLVMILSMLITHGFNKISYSALVSVIVTIFLTSIFGIFALQFTQMQGNNEQSIYLQAQGLDLRGILFAGILIGTLGVLDDIAITQAVCIDQSTKNHYKNAITMGKEHLGSMINTLALAYLGSFLPSLLVLANPKFQEGRPLWIVFNSELLQGEIVRTIVGVFALIIIVPTSTFVSLLMIKKQTPKQIWDQIICQDLENNQI